MSDPEKMNEILKKRNHIKEVNDAILDNEKDRLNLAMIQVLQEHEKSRSSDLQQAQDLINKAQSITIYTIGAMLALPVIHIYIALVGILLISNNALGTYYKYKSRVETRLRANVLRRWHFKSRYDLMQKFDCVSHNISIKKVDMWSLIKCKGSIAFSYFAFIAIITTVTAFDIPSLAVVKTATKTLLPLVGG